MAISKILHMKDSGNSFHARHLKRSLDYVMNPEKTQDGRLVGAINCQADMAFEQMMDTKKQFGKTDKRQGITSFFHSKRMKWNRTGLLR